MSLPLPASRLSLALILSCAAPAALLAQTPPDRLPLGPYEASVVETGDFNRQLLVDGKVLAEDGLVLLDQALELGGVSLVTGVAGAGGNACNATPFVVWLQEGLPQIAGPIDSCSYFETEVRGDRLIFTSAALPGSPAEIWHWSPSEGLRPDQAEGFSPDASETWADFSGLAGKHPIEAMSFGPVYSLLSQSMSPEDWESYIAILSGLGSGDLGENGYSGSACVKLNCDAERAWLWIDPARQQAVALWMGPEDEEPLSWPYERADWPEWVQLEAARIFSGAG